jgi:hypothetical protein
MFARLIVNAETESEIAAAFATLAARKAGALLVSSGIAFQ